MAYDASSVYSLLSSIFRIPSEWLQFPLILTNVIAPVILLAFAFYKLLEKLRIFREHSTIDAILSILVALVLIPIGPVAAIAAAGFIGMFGLRSWPHRIVFVLILVVFYFIAMPYLSSIKI
jgi:chromate transport protein ChrA